VHDRAGADSLPRERRAPGDDLTADEDAVGEGPTDELHHHGRPGLEGLGHGTEDPSMRGVADIVLAKVVRPAAANSKDVQWRGTSPLTYAFAMCFGLLMY
jgi:hypothetical protein